jgi:CubicO group peptidase (beta-lactamase class C family)
VTAAATDAPPTTEAPTTTEDATTGLGLPVADGLPALPAQPDGVPFPTEEWPTAELPGYVDRAAVDAAIDTAFGSTDNTQVRSALIVIGGEVVYERYHAPDTADTVMDSYSVAKSFTSAVIGLVAGDGDLDVLGRAERQEWADPSDPRHEITVENLLHMSSGLEWTEGIEEYTGLFAAPSHAAYAADRPLVAEPDTVWNYSTGTTGILAALAADKVGGPGALQTYITERLFEPLGITSTVLLTDETGTWRGGLGANSTARDFARFGLLFLRDGVWDGERILPEGWVDYSRTPSRTSEIYGAQWWLGPDNVYFEAQGLFGQRIRVIPELDAVIVATTHNGGDTDRLVTDLQELITPAS